MDEQTNNFTDDLYIPKVSIITVCFNSICTITDTIESVIHQSYPNIEYIIIDGYSTDGTVDIIRKYEKNIVKWVSEPDKGIYDAMNKGIRMATGEIVGIINSDDYYVDSDTVSSIMTAYKDNHNVDIIYGDVKYLDLDKGITYINKSLDDPSKFRFGTMPICHPATFVTMKTYNDIGLFNENFRNSSDYEFILRCIRRGKRFVKVNKVLTAMRSGGASTNYLKTFSETRDINLMYGCSAFIAWSAFIESVIKTTLVNIFGKNKLLTWMYSRHKTNTN